MLVASTNTVNNRDSVVLTLRLQQDKAGIIMVPRVIKIAKVTRLQKSPAAIAHQSAD
jgi:hypothetical protein